MKQFVLIFLCLMLVLSGCGQKQAQVSTTPAATEAAVTEPAPETEPVTEAKEETVPAYTVSTKYYTLTLPAEWEQTCAVELFQQESGLYVLGLYEAIAREEFGGGNLCSIQLMSEGDDTYKDFPSYQWLGQLETSDGSYNVIVLYPTDVQFSENAVEAYNEMSAQLQDVLCTLTPVEGVELMMPAPAL